MKTFVLFLAIVFLMVNEEAIGGPLGESAYFKATDVIQAEDFSVVYESQRGSGASAGACSDPDVVYVGYNTVNSYFGYFRVDFGAGAEMIVMRLASWVSEDVYGVINISLDEVDATPIARIPIRTTTEGDYCKFFTLPAFLVGMPEGVHDLYFTFSQPQNQPFVNIDWFTFNDTAAN